MAMKVVGAGVGRTGTNSLKIALESLLGGPCHHMFEIIANPQQIPGWTDAIEGRDIDWGLLLDGYVAQVDWPGASFWPELAAANPDALVILSVREPDAWYESASNTIFQVFDTMPPEMAPWFESMRSLMGARFSADLENPAAMMDAFERHNDGGAGCRPRAAPARVDAHRRVGAAVRALGAAVPDEPFPCTNQTTVWRENLGMPAL